MILINLPEAPRAIGLSLRKQQGIVVACPMEQVDHLDGIADHTIKDQTIAVGNAPHAVGLKSANKLAGLRLRCNLPAARPELADKCNAAPQTLLRDPVADLVEVGLGFISEDELHVL